MSISHTTTCRCHDPTSPSRCARHTKMMDAIHLAWFNSDHVTTAILELADGFGEPGSMMEQGTLDWLGISGSSVDAVEAMYAVAVEEFRPAR